MQKQVRNFDLGDLAKFLVRAKRNSWAATTPDPDIFRGITKREGFTEISCADGDFFYTDTYAGSSQFGGQEIVSFQGIPVWAMHYFGGIVEHNISDMKIINQIYASLKKALWQVDQDRPFRGPKYFDDLELHLVYRCAEREDYQLTLFDGTEEITPSNNPDLGLYHLKYFGGLIRHE